MWWNNGLIAPAGGIKECVGSLHGAPFDSLVAHIIIHYMDHATVRRDVQEISAYIFSQVTAFALGVYTYVYSFDLQDPSRSLFDRELDGTTSSRYHMRRVGCCFDGQS